MMKKTAGFQAKMVQKGGIVNTRTCDLNEGWNIAAKVEQRVHFDTRTTLGCRGPVEQAQAQIDGGGVDGIHTLIQVQPKSILAVKTASNTDEVHGKVFKDPAVSSLFGIGQSGAGNPAAKPCVVKLARVRAQAKLNVTKACSRCELGKHHAQELVPVREAECAAGQWTIQIDLDLTSKKSIQIMRLAAGPGKSPDSSGSDPNFLEGTTSPAIHLT
jgi:hypothetical protein